MSSSAAKGGWESEGGGQTHAKCLQGLIARALLDTRVQNTVGGVRPALPGASVFPPCFKWHTVAVVIPPQSDQLTWCPCTISQSLTLGSTAEHYAQLLNDVTKVYDTSVAGWM